MAKVVDTGMFETFMPENVGDLLREVIERMSDAEAPFLRFTSVARDHALSEIAKEGFPVKAGPDELLKAPPHILAAYRLLAVDNELSIRLEPLLSSTRVLNAVLTALIETYGDAPRQMYGALIVKPSDESGARDELLHIVLAAIQLGILSQRLASQQHEPTFVTGRKVREGGKKGSELAYHKEQQELNRQKSN